jgi:hypothetical protein
MKQPKLLRLLPESWFDPKETADLDIPYANKKANFDTAESYCLRLAEVTQQRLKQEQGSRVGEQLNLVLPIPDGESKKSSELNLFGLQRRLYFFPESQLKVARLVDYMPSKWLLEQEMQLYKPDADPPHNKPPEKRRAIQYYAELKDTDKTNDQGGPGENLPVNGAVDQTTHVSKNPTKISENGDVYNIAFNHHLRGLCFSGGGIRSATFSLGVLQGLVRLDLFRQFDYLSTVSGGGYLHQCIATWIHRDSFENVNKALDPIPNEPGKTRPRVSAEEPINWLRRYSNYLTPQKGMFSADTWTMIAIWLRNTGLNLIILIATFLTLLLVPHLLVSHQVFTLAHAWARNPHILPWISFGLLLAAAISLGWMLRPVNEQCSQVGSAGSGMILLLVLAPIIAAVVMISPSVYTTARFVVPAEIKGKCLTQFFSVAPCKPESATLSACKPVVASRETVVCRVRHGWTEHPSFCSVASSPATQWFAAGVLSLMWMWGIATAKLRTRGGFGRLMGALVFPILCGGLAILLLWGLEVLIFLSFSLCSPEEAKFMGAVLVPTLLLAVPFICSAINIGLIGRDMDDAQREWLARLRALSFLGALGWLGLAGISLLGPSIFDGIAKYTAGNLTVWGGWASTTVASVISGKSPKTTGGPSDNKSTQSKTLEWVARIGPPVFIIGLFLLLSKLAYWMIESACASDNPAVSFRYLLYALGGSIATMLLFGWRVDINDFSMHGFYRDRLARCYSGAARSDPSPGQPMREPNAFTGFDPRDRELRLVELLPKRFGGNVYEGPFPIFCSTLNLTGGKELAYQQRQAASFAFTPMFSGYSVGWTSSRDPEAQINGFVPTDQYVYTGKANQAGASGISVATVTAISGAALNPNDGYNTQPAVAFLMTLFNVRLGWWLRNPRMQKFRIGKPSSPRFGLYHLLSELMAKVDDTKGFVNLSDGGHFDDMGLYELVRRRCRCIVICDGECDADLSFDGLTEAIRKCRLDFGAEIQIDRISDMKSIQNKVHVVTGTITYAEHSDMPGIVIYIKTSLTEDEPADVQNYRHSHPTFPQESTTDQWFTESQFESYRRLGQHIVLDHAEIKMTLKKAVLWGLPPSPLLARKRAIAP